MKKSVKLVMIIVLLMAGGCTIQKKEENAKTLGETIKEYRMKCNMTQEFVAESLGVSRQAVSKWESGTSSPSTTNLIALAKLFGVEAEELLKQIK